MNRRRNRLNPEIAPLEGRLLLSGLNPPPTPGTTGYMEPSGRLVVVGTDANDLIYVSQAGPRTVVVDGNVTYTGVNSIYISAKQGNDTVLASSSTLPIEAAGGKGDDYIAVTGGAADIEEGDDGNDELHAPAQATVFGGNGNDRIFGGTTIDAGSGDDYIVPGAGGSVTAGAGHDTIVFNGDISLVPLGGVNGGIAVYSGHYGQKGQKLTTLIDYSSSEDRIIGNL
jgi:hypothetical protein